MPKTKKIVGPSLHCATTNSCKKFCTVHIFGTTQECCGKREGKYSSCRLHPRQEFQCEQVRWKVSKSGRVWGQVSNNLRPFLFVCLFFGRCQRRMSGIPCGFHVFGIREVMPTVTRKYKDRRPIQALTRLNAN